MIFVVDASVVIKWYVEENDWEAARGLLASTAALHAPELLQAECANTLWKKVRRKNLELADALAILREVLMAPIGLHPSADVIDAAWHLATAADRTVYDALYAALAIAVDCPLVTADSRLVNALQAAAIPVDVRHISNWEIQS